MTQDEIIDMARQVIDLNTDKRGRNTFLCDEYGLERFAKLIAQHEREVISDEWWDCYQSDLENGVKSLNEYAAKKFATTYPELAKFGAWLEERDKHD